MSNIKVLGPWRCGTLGKSIGLAYGRLGGSRKKGSDSSTAKRSAKGCVCVSQVLGNDQYTCKRMPRVTVGVAH